MNPNEPTASDTAPDTGKTSSISSPPLQRNDTLNLEEVQQEQEQQAKRLHQHDQQSSSSMNSSINRKHPKYIRGEQTHSTIAELSEAFRMFTNVNGIVPQSVISQKDLMKVMEQTGMRPTAQDVGSQIQVIDQNRIGNISFDEFASLMGRTVPIEEVDSLQAAFAGIDKNQTGIVTVAQFTQLMSTYGEHSTPEEVAEMLAFADPNSTGKVNYRVFLRMLGLRLR